MKYLLISLSFISLLTFADDGGGVGGGGGPQMKAWQVAVNTVRFSQFTTMALQDGRVITVEEVEHVEYQNEWSLPTIKNVNWFELRDSSVYYKDEIISVNYNKFKNLKDLYPIFSDLILDQ